jgi:hypothetical protein
MMKNVYVLRIQIMSHIGLVALKAQIMGFIVQSILLQRYRRWDIYRLSECFIHTI